MKFFITAILPLFLLAACVTDDVPRNEGVSVGDRLPQFQITLDNGADVSTDSLLGSVSVIIFFSTSCTDCQRELPRLNEVYTHFKDDSGVIVFAVSREEQEQQVMSFWKEYSLTMPFSVQTDRYVYSLFASFGVPRVYISDASNIIVEAFDDSDLPSPEIIINIIEQYSKENIN